MDAFELADKARAEEETKWMAEYPAPGARWARLGGDYVHHVASSCNPLKVWDEQIEGTLAKGEHEADREDRPKILFQYQPTLAD
ncbi:MAG: hypothetical protein LQ350_005489 [Teloschistes chrysophthalmus]|nr:MAG: hypothetical protein LQ350_005489 [Niorma chrysophthalma]